MLDDRVIVERPHHSFETPQSNLNTRSKAASRFFSTCPRAEISPRRDGPRFSPLPALAGIVLALAACRHEEPQAVTPATVVPPPAQVENEFVPAAPEEKPSDDGVTVWASPTSGNPWDIQGVAPGAQLLIHVNGPRIFQSDEGQKLLRCVELVDFNPVVFLESECDVSPGNVESLLVAYYPRDRGPPVVTVAVNLREPWRPDTDWQPSPDATDGIKERNGLHAAELREGRLLVLSKSTELVAEIIETPGTSLRQAVARLHEAADRDRAVEILGSNRFLLTDGREILNQWGNDLPGLWSELIGEDVDAFSLSLHWDANLYVEARAIARSETAPSIFRERLVEQFRNGTDRLASAAEGLPASPYAADVLPRFAKQIRAVPQFVRSANDRRMVLLNAYLPRAAAHHFLLGTELLLLERRRPHREELVTAGPPVDVSDLQGLLDRKMDFVVPGMELAEIFEYFRQESGLPLEVEWDALTKASVTKNHRVQVDLRGQPAEVVLADITRQASKEGTCAFIVMPAEDNEPGKIVVTTPARVEQLSGSEPKGRATRKRESSL
jgi:hypothetical protein